jgi:hypothetical protein
MIILEDSDEAITGLAKIIAQDPTFPIKLRNDKRKLLEEKAITDNPTYFQKQEEILKKAEERGLVSTGYIFEVDTSEEEYYYMVYRNIKDEMVPLIKEFKKSSSYAIHGDILIDTLKKYKITNLITFEPSFQEAFYSFPWLDKSEDEDEDDDFGLYAAHNKASFYRDNLKELIDNGITLQFLSDDEAWEFNLHLKDLTSD